MSEAAWQSLKAVLDNSQRLYKHEVPKGKNEDDYTDGFMAAWWLMTEIINTEMAALKKIKL